MSPLWSFFWNERPQRLLNPVVVQQINDEEVEIAAVDPVASMQAVENEALEPIAKEIREKLGAVVARATG